MHIRPTFFLLMGLEIRIFLVFHFPSSPTFKVQSICEVTVIINNLRRLELAPCSHKQKVLKRKEKCQVMQTEPTLQSELIPGYFPAKQISLLKDIFSNFFFLQMPHERAVPLENILTLRHSEVSIKNAAKPSRTPILKENNHFLKNICTLTQD